MRCPGALHFTEMNTTVISYGIQTNSTPANRRGHYEDPTLKFQIPFQIAVEREIARSLIGSKNHMFLDSLFMTRVQFVMCLIRPSANL